MTKFERIILIILSLFLVVLFFASIFLHYKHRVEVKVVTMEAPHAA